jgi:hypothetical protein
MVFNSPFSNLLVQTRHSAVRTKDSDSGCSRPGIGEYRTASDAGILQKLENLPIV